MARGGTRSTRRRSARTGAARALALALFAWAMVARPEARGQTPAAPPAPSEAVAADAPCPRAPEKTCRALTSRGASSAAAARVEARRSAQGEGTPPGGTSPEHPSDGCSGCTCLGPYYAPPPPPPPVGSVGTSFDLVDAFERYQAQLQQPGYPLDEVARTIAETLRARGYEASVVSPPVGRYTADVAGARSEGGARVEVYVHADARPDGMSVTLYYAHDQIDDAAIRALIRAIDAALTPVIVSVVLATP